MLLFLVILLLCGLVTPQVRVINGGAIEPFSYTFVVSIQHKDGFHYCGGSLIDRGTVITAAHCILVKEKGDIASIRRHNIKKGVKQENGTNIELDNSPISHPKYNRTSKYADIAIWKLKQLVPKEMKIDYVRMMNSELKYDLTLHHLKIIGWGMTDFKGKLETSPVLKEIIVKPVESKICKDMWAPIDVSDKFCATYETNRKQRVCKGDSGGPLFYQDNDTKKFVQLGIVSIGDDECDITDKLPDAFIRFNPHMDWILKNIKKSDADGTPVN